MRSRYRSRAVVRPGCGPPAWPGVQAAGEAGLTVRVLGPVRVWQAGRLPTGPAQRQLVVAALALRAGTEVPREELVDAL